MTYFKPFTLPVPPEFPARDFDIRDYGATPGGNASEAIRAAIDACSTAGGGRVVIPAGEWHTGPIHLKSGVNLHASAGAYVHFSTDFYDYLPVVYGILAGNRVYSVSHFLYAYRCRDIAVTGAGTFDGHGEAWWYMKKQQPGMEDLMKKGKALRPLSERVYDKPEDGVRPRMLQFVECENVLIEGITMKNSPSWTVHPAWCSNIIVRGLTIRNPADAPNTDGVNLESCRRGLVEDCDVSTGDDMVCLKAGRDEDAWEVGIPCEDIEIRNCRALTGHGGITIGSETSASIRNAYLHDCTFGSLFSAVRIKTMKGRGGVVENLDFENLTIEHATHGALSVTMRYTGEPLDDQSKPIENMPEVRNISVKNLRCVRADHGIELIGEAGYPLKNITLSDIDITARDTARIVNVENLHTENLHLREYRD